MSKLKELPIGEHFGKWVIIRESAPKRDKNGKLKRRVELKCECGTVKEAWFYDVKNYSIYSSCKKCREINPTHNLTGMTSGALTVTSEVIKNHSGRIVWGCSCECGGHIYLSKKQIETESVKNCGVCSSKKGFVHIGDIKTNRDGFSVTLLKFLSSHSYLVEGEGCLKPFIVNSTTFKNCTFVSPYKVTVGGVGYYGEGIFLSKVDGVHTPEYRDWSCMLKRCYIQAPQYASYTDVDVCEEWHNFQDFAEWSTRQYNVNREGWRLDKDLLGTLCGKKLYSPETCVYLPVEINNFIKTKRMNDLPIGVDTVENRYGTRFRAQAREYGHNVTLGVYETVEEAFLTYKTHKECLAKELANKYKQCLPEKAYTALINYTVLETF